ncbi:MAG: GNAT family N-acetyltransferase [Pseudomonadota bacterium]
MVEITKTESKEEIDAVFDGNAPHDHPDDFWQTRISEKRVFIAKKEGNPVGLLTYSVWWGNTTFLELIHIQDAHQREGIATKLLTVACKEIKSERLISSCEIINSKSLSFHKALGFQKLNSLELPHGEEQFYSIDLDKLK